MTPTSERPVIRVYPPATALETVPPVTTTTVVPTSSDLAMADTIRKRFDADPSFSSATKNVQVGVYHGTVTLRGTVPTNHEREELQARVATVPGVDSVTNMLETNLR